MIRKILSRLALPVIATTALLVVAGPALAQHHGGFHAGGFHAGAYRGGFGGYHSGHHPYAGYHPYLYRPYYGYRAYYPYYHGYYPYPYAGLWHYPDYLGGWSDPYAGAGYYSYYPSSSSSTPSSSSAASETSTPPTQAAGTGAMTSSVSSDTVSSASASATPSAGTTTDNTAHITVRLPDLAELWFDSSLLPATGRVRDFNTPPLVPGQKYTYTVRARWLDKDTEFDQKQTIVFTAGSHVEVKFQAPSETSKGKSASTP